MDNYLKEISALLEFEPKHITEPASVAQLDGRPTGDQEVAGSTPARSTVFFCGDRS